MAGTTIAPSFLSIPAELRNHIYGLLFPPPRCQSLGKQCQLDLPPLSSFGEDVVYSVPCATSRSTGVAAIALGCRQLQRETQLLFLGTTLFHLTGSAADPVVFATLASHLPLSHRQAVRHIVLSARISHLRSMNETWNALPFGSGDFFLETLTLVPRRPEIHERAWAEVADLSQSHTLAYILGETLKSLRHVGIVIVCNEGCFNEVIWQLTYRSLVFRLWKWGGRLCELKVCENEAEKCFAIKCNGWPNTRADDLNDTRTWKDIGEELNRLVGEGDQGRRPSASV